MQFLRNLLQNNDGTKHPWVKGVDLRLYYGEPYFSQKGDNQSLNFFFISFNQFADIIIDLVKFYIHLLVAVYNGPMGLLFIVTR